MHYKAVLIDIDDTLFDFRQSSFEALVHAFAHWGYSFTQADMPHYEVYNDRLWCAFERGEVERDFIFTERFRLYFAERGITGVDASEFNEVYQHALAEGYAFMPHCHELIQALYGKYKIFVVTNGDTYAQESRIAKSGLADYFDGVFISEQLGCKKPEKEFYDKVFAIIGEEYRTCSLMVGDSLTSDMQGGRNAGIPTCYYGKPENADERCDYVIEDLLQLPDVLSGMQAPRAAALLS